MPKNHIPKLQGQPNNLVSQVGELNKQLSDMRRGWIQEKQRADKLEKELQEQKAVMSDWLKDSGQYTVYNSAIDSCLDIVRPNPTMGENLRNFLSTYMVEIMKLRR